MNKSVLDQVLGDMEAEFKAKREGPANQAATAAPKENSLVLTQHSAAQLTATRLPEIRPANNSRVARKEAEEEQKRQWRIVQSTQRTMLAASSMIGATVHAQRQLDAGQEALTGQFYGTNRHEVGNEFMQGVTSRCMAMMEAGVMAILESHPRRIAEDL